jgi:peptidylprolyl isomerase
MSERDYALDARPIDAAGASRIVPADVYAAGVMWYRGFPLATDAKVRGAGHVWPVHCYGSVGVGRNLSPDTGSGAELYAVIGHAPRHLDRNIAVVGRVIEGMEHLSSLPRGTGDLGFYTDAAQRTPITSIRLASEVPAAERPHFAYLSSTGTTWPRYLAARQNREPPFFTRPAGAADVCNIPVPIRAVPTAGRITVPSVVHDGYGSVSSRHVRTTRGRRVLGRQLQPLPCRARRYAPS